MRVFLFYVFVTTSYRLPFGDVAIILGLSGLFLSNVPDLVPLYGSSCLPVLSSGPGSVPYYPNSPKRLLKASLRWSSCG